MSDNDKKLSKFTKDEMELLLHGKDKKFKAKFSDRAINLTYTGIIEKIERSYPGQCTIEVQPCAAVDDGRLACSAGVVPSTIAVERVAPDSDPALAAALQASLDTLRLFCTASP